MNWKNMSTAEKIILVILCIGALILALAFSNPNLFSINPTYPIIAAVTAFEGIVEWKKNRKMACLMIVGAIISLACFLLELSL